MRVLVARGVVLEHFVNKNGILFDLSMVDAVMRCEVLRSPYEI